MKMREVVPDRHGVDDWCWDHSLEIWMRCCVCLVGSSVAAHLQTRPVRNLITFSRGVLRTGVDLIMPLGVSGIEKSLTSARKTNKEQTDDWIVCEYCDWSRQTWKTPKSSFPDRKPSVGEDQCGQFTGSQPRLVQWSDRRFCATQKPKPGFTAAMVYFCQLPAHHRRTSIIGQSQRLVWLIWSDFKDRRSLKPSWCPWTRTCEWVGGSSWVKRFFFPLICRAFQSASPRPVTLDTRVA